MVKQIRTQLILCFQSADESLTLPELQRFPVKDQFENIVAEIQNHYEHFGIQLLEDSHGVRIKGTENSIRGDLVAITVEILRQWLQGKGRTPVTWQTFVECLLKSGLNVPADYIEAALVEEIFQALVVLTYEKWYQILVSVHFLISSSFSN